MTDDQMLARAISVLSHFNADVMSGDEMQSYALESIAFSLAVIAKHTVLMNTEQRVVPNLTSDAEWKMHKGA